MGNKSGLRRKRVFVTISLALVLFGALAVQRIAPFAESSSSANHPVKAKEPTASKDASGTKRHLYAGVTSQQRLHGEQTNDLLARFTYGKSWDHQTRPAFLAFKEWTDRYFAAPNSEKRLLLVEGIALAKVRRKEMAQLISVDPKAAIDESVPALVRTELPQEILANLENRVAGQGDLLVIGRTNTDSSTSVYREVAFGNTYYNAYVYGERQSETTKRNIPLNGIALDGEMAVHESAIRALEPNETIETDSAVISMDEAASDATSSSENRSVPRVATIASTVPIQIGDTYALLPHAEDATTLANYFSRLEAGINPKVAAITLDHSLLRNAASTQVIAQALPPTSWTTGSKKLLIAFFDFSDRPGFPANLADGTTVTTATAQSLIVNSVNPYYIETSYNKTSLAVTVDSNLYRLPKTGQYYASQTNGSDLLMTDARALMKESPDSFDRYIIVFANLSGFGTNITYAGQGYIGDSGVWINGWYDMPTVAHELGHNYGLNHANIWQSYSANPIDTNGASIEYGDNYDIMGQGSDARAHFNMWHKNELGWLPDKATTTVSKSGTYRVYRFDDANVNLNNTLALKIAHDNTRTYWIGLRQKYFEGSPSTGAYIIWGYPDTNQQSDLLRFDGQNSLQLGSSFEDDVAGFSLKVIGSGGSAPNEYLDIQVYYLGTTALPATNITSTGFTAQWTADPNANDYYLDVSIDSDFYNIVNKYSSLEVGNTTSYVVTGLNPNTTYYYRIHEGSSGATSPSTKTITVTTGQPVNSQVIRAHTGDTVTLPQLTSPNGNSVFWLKNSTYDWMLNSGTISNALLQDTGFYTAIYTANTGDTYLKSFFVVISDPASDLHVWNLTGTRFDNDATANSLHDLAQVAIGADNMAVLKGDGTVYEWGDNSHGQNTLPAGLNNVVRIALGTDFSIALRGDGTVVAWGLNDQGQCNVPAGLKNVISIAAGSDFAAAATSDGTLVIWGANATTGAHTIPSEVGKIGLVAGSEHTIAVVETTGALRQWTIGSAQDQFLGVGDEFAAFSTSSQEVLGIDYFYSAFGITFASKTNSVPSDDINALDIAASTSVDLAISRYNNQIEAWGPNASLITPTGDALAVAAGTNAAAAIVHDPGLPYFPNGSINGPSTVATSGGTYTVSVSNATGYQWQGSKDGGVTWSNLTDDNNFSGTSTTSLTISNVSISLNGEEVRLVATGTSGSNTTAAATIVFSDPSLSRLSNIATRSFVGNGASVQIAGFIISGSQPKTVLIRAGGPSLTPFGVNGVLPDPVLTLYSGQTVIGSNDDWDASTVQSAFTAVQTSMWTPGSKDAAMIVTLQPGGYTAQVAGKNGQTGVALVEVFEYDTTPSASKLVNLSTRSFVGTGPNIQIAGFIVSGGSPKHVLIRAGGPSLIPYGVNNALADPVLNVYSGQTVIATNDDWDTNTITPVANAAGVPAWTPGSKDAALYLTLNPGGYTAQVTGKNSSTGVALVEVFELP